MHLQPRLHLNSKSPRLPQLIMNFTNDESSALSKVLNISGSIETIRFSETARQVVPQFDNHKELYWALADNTTLTTLIMPTASGQYIYNLANIGKAIGINAKRGGSLINVDLSGSIDNSALSNFFESMRFSDKNEAEWKEQYQEANAMEKEQLNKETHYKLKQLNLRGANWMQ